jgi:hypothetical protein
MDYELGPRVERAMPVCREKAESPACARVISLGRAPGHWRFQWPIAFQKAQGIGALQNLSGNSARVGGNRQALGSLNR